jgi:hypothetical protein
MKHKRYRILILSAILFAVPMGYAQQPIVRSSGPEVRPAFRGRLDSEFSYPQVEGSTGQKDVGAMEELKASASAFSSSDIEGIEASGIISIGTGENLRELNASLVAEKGNRYRLDVSTEAGNRSVLYDGARELVKANGAISGMPGRILGERIILPFQLLEVAKRSEVAVIDDGNQTVEGRALHRITIITPIRTSSPSAEQSASSLVASSFYFDPATHRLLKSIGQIPYASGNLPKMLKVITYGDYRKVQDIVAPFLITETNNGQLGMTFKLSNLSTTNGHDKAFFQD